MALFAGKTYPGPGILLFMLSITTGWWTKFSSCCNLCTLHGGGKPWIGGQKSLKCTLCQSIISYSTPYLAVRQGKRVTLSCSFEKKLRLNVTWYKDEEQPIKVKELKGIVTGNEDNISWVIIEKATKFHSGVYYCSCPSMDTARTQCGTEVNVIQNSVKKETNTIYTMKDMLILIQGILLILCLTLPGMLFFNKNNQAKKTEETETYHMYEGLEVMQAAMYEDIGNVKSSDAKWTLGEQPNE